MVAAKDHIGDTSLIWKSFVWQPEIFGTWSMKNKGKNEEVRERHLWLVKIDNPKSVHLIVCTWLIGKPFNLFFFFSPERVHIFLINFLASTTFRRALRQIRIKETWLLGTGTLIVRCNNLDGQKNYEKQIQEHKKKTYQS